jgi:hypothetical protein
MRAHFVALSLRGVKSRVPQESNLSYRPPGPTDVPSGSSVHGWTLGTSVAPMFQAFSCFVVALRLWKSVWTHPVSLHRTRRRESRPAVA